MPFHLVGTALNRKTTIGQKIEQFINDNENEFSLNQLKLLESLADDVEQEAEELESELNQLEDLREYL